ncbi:hypothetical protein [Kribbella endophytica]
MPLVDLDDPEELRARWSALAAVAHATGFDRRWYADADGWYHQDETGSDLRMVRLSGGRSVLFGYHTQHSRTAGTDLLAGAPDWIGQPEVKRRITAGDLGFVYGSFNGTWARASYEGDPWQPVDDGFGPIGSWITSDEEAARELVEWAAEWADYLGGLDELVPLGVGLIRSAAASTLSAEQVGEFFARLGVGPRSAQQPDVYAALVAVQQFSQVPGAPAVAAPPAPAPVVEEPEEELFIVPPGVSPFTGQPITEDPHEIIGAEPTYEAQSYEPEPSYETPSDPEPAVDDYGVVSKKPRLFGRKKKQPREEDNASLAGLGLAAPDPTPAAPPPPAAPPRTYDRPLPSSEPPRVGAPVEDGEDFYASLYADAPAAARYTPDTPTDQQPAEPPWSANEATNEIAAVAEETAPYDHVGEDTAQYNPVADDTAPFTPFQPQASSGANSPFAPPPSATEAPGSPFAPHPEEAAPAPEAHSPFAPHPDEAAPAPEAHSPFAPPPDTSPFAPEPSPTSAADDTGAITPVDTDQSYATADDDTGVIAPIDADAPPSSTTDDDDTGVIPPIADPGTTDAFTAGDDTGVIPPVADAFAESTQDDDTGVIPPVAATPTDVVHEPSPLDDHSQHPPHDLQPRPGHDTPSPSPADESHDDQSHSGPDAPRDQRPEPTDTPQDFQPASPLAAPQSHHPTSRPDTREDHRGYPPSADPQSQQPGSQPWALRDHRAGSSLEDLETRRPDSPPQAAQDQRAGSSFDIGQDQHQGYPPPAAQDRHAGSSVDADRDQHAGAPEDAARDQHADTFLDVAEQQSAGSSADAARDQGPGSPLDAARYQRPDSPLDAAQNRRTDSYEDQRPGPGSPLDATRDQRSDSSSDAQDQRPGSPLDAARDQRQDSTPDARDHNPAAPSDVRQPPGPTSPLDAFAPDHGVSPEPSPMEREWVGGAWINGEWIEDVAAYLAANPHLAHPPRPARRQRRTPSAEPGTPDALQPAPYAGAHPDINAEARPEDAYTADAHGDDASAADARVADARVDDADADDRAHFDRRPDADRADDSQGTADLPTESIEALPALDEPEDAEDLQQADVPRPADEARAGDSGAADVQRPADEAGAGDSGAADARHPADEARAGDSGAADARHPADEAHVAGRWAADVQRPAEEAGDGGGADARRPAGDAQGEDGAAVDAPRDGDDARDAEYRRATDVRGAVDEPGADDHVAESPSADPRAVGDRRTADLPTEAFQALPADGAPETDDRRADDQQADGVRRGVDGQGADDPYASDGSGTEPHADDDRRGADLPTEYFEALPADEVGDANDRRDVDVRGGADGRRAGDVRGGLDEQGPDDPATVAQGTDSRGDGDRPVAELPTEPFDALAADEPGAGDRHAPDVQADAGEPGGGDVDLEDEAPTAEIAAVVDEPAEDIARVDSGEGTAAGDGPRTYPPLSDQYGGSGDELDDFEYANEFHDEILGSADWTADQLGEISTREARPEVEADAGTPEQDAEPHVAEVDEPEQQDAEPLVAEVEQQVAEADDAEELEAEQGPAAEQTVEDASAEQQLADEQAAAEQEPADEQADAEQTPAAEVVAVGIDEVAVSETTHEPDDTAEVVGLAEALDAYETDNPAGMHIPELSGAGVPIALPLGVEQAMRAEAERPRPRPKESDAFEALRAWCRARTNVVPSGFTIQVQVLDPARPSYRFDLEPAQVDDEEWPDDRLSELLGDLWIEEAQTDHGGWLFARIDAAGRTLRIDRWYDQVPEWWDTQLPGAIDVEGLVRRLYGRGPEWQPSYLEQLYITAG